MDDKELIERAARAAGITGWWYEEWKCLVYMGAPAVINNRTVSIWSPLTNDGDALQLAVKLGLCVSIDTENHCAEARFTLPGKLSSDYCVEDSNSAPVAATRRAIVRAAAAMADNQGGV